MRGLEQASWEKTASLTPYIKYCRSSAGKQANNEHCFRNMNQDNIKKKINICLWHPKIKPWPFNPSSTLKTDWKNCLLSTASWANPSDRPPNRNLQSVSNCKNWDTTRKFWFHSSVEKVTGLGGPAMNSLRALVQTLPNFWGEMKWSEMLWTQVKGSDSPSANKVCKQTSDHL